MADTDATIVAEANGEGITVKAKKNNPIGFLDRWISFLLVAYIPLLLVAGALSFFSFEIAKGLKLNANITSLMPDGVPSVENLKNVIEKTGGYSNAMVLVESPDPEAALRYLKDLREQISDLDWATSAEYSQNTAVF